MLVLPKGAFTVVPDKKEEKTKGGLILGIEDQKEPDTGVIGFTAPELKELKGSRVRFRKGFGEELDIDGVTHLYFRDYNSSIYYGIKGKRG